MPGRGADPPARTDRRILVIGLDGADERLIDAGITAGRLPTLARLRREGASGPLRTYRPYLSPILWTTIDTGLTPDRHGVLDFVETDAAGRTVPVSSRSRRAPALWDRLGERGVSSAVVGWLATWPAGRINGVMVSDRFTIHPYEGTSGTTAAANPGAKTWPEELYGELEDTIASPSSIRDDELAAAYGAPPRAVAGEEAIRRELRVIEAMARTYEAAAIRLLRSRAPEFAAVYFEGIDRAMHLFGPMMPPPLPGVDPSAAARYGGIMDGVYAAMDARLGRLIEAAGKGATVLVLSDHGFRLGSERPRHPALREDVFAAEWHRSPGVLLAWGRGVRNGVRIDGATIYDIAPTVLALFGAPATNAMRGRPLDEIFQPGFLPPRPAQVPEPAPREAAPREAEGAGDAEILENLRALGYVGGGQDAEQRVAANLATFYLEEKEYDRAIELYRRVLARDPGDLTALYNLGWAYKQLGTPAKAVECFEAVLRKRPDYLEARLVLSECLAMTGRGKDALAVLEEGEPGGREDAAFQNHLGTVLASAGRLEAAEKALRRAIALRPDEASAYLNLARVQAAGGNLEGAEGTLREAEREAPADPRIEARRKELGLGGARR